GLADVAVFGADGSEPPVGDGPADRGVDLVGAELGGFGGVPQLVHGEACPGGQAVENLFDDGDVEFGHGVSLWQSQGQGSVSWSTVRRVVPGQVWWWPSRHQPVRSVTTRPPCPAHPPATRPPAPRSPSARPGWRPSTTPAAGRCR